MGTELDLNFTGVTESEFPLIPPGRYHVSVFSLEPQTSAEGNPYLKWVFMVEDGEFAGQKLFYNSSLQQQALWSLKRDLRQAFNIDEDGEFGLDTDDFVEESLGVIVSNELYEGSMRSQVDQLIAHKEVGAVTASGPDF